MRRLAFLGLAALLLTACGRKGPPVAPERRLPQAVSELSAVVRDGAIELTWTNPSRRADNSRLRDLSLVRVYRTEDTGVGEPKPALLSGGRIAGYREIAVVDLAAPAPALVQGPRVQLADGQELSYGRRYTYVVLGADSLGRTSPPGRRVSVTFIAPPELPGNVVAEPGEGEARLRWEPPARLVDGSPTIGGLAYEVLRATAADAPLETVTPTAIAEPRLTDRSLQNDRTYYYAVRAIRTEAGSTARGEPSPRVAVTPTKMRPPSPPTNLVAVPSEGVVRLAWNPSPDADVAAYLVYRAPERGPLVRIGSVQAPATAFVDRNLTRATYRYAVTAQDSSARRNESAPSNEVPVTLP